MYEGDGYLVTVKVYLLGGQVVTATDAFPEDGNNGENYARNTFIQGRGAVVYGDAVIILDAMTAVEIVNSEWIDLSDMDNIEWRRAIEVFERMMDEESEADRPSETAPWTGPEESVQGR